MILAPISPIKVRPADPGGMKIPYQNITVLNPEPPEVAEPLIHLRPPPETPLEPLVEFLRQRSLKYDDGVP